MKHVGPKQQARVTQDKKYIYSETITVRLGISSSGETVCVRQVAPPTGCY